MYLKGGKMEVKNFSLLELLQSRIWLVAVMNSTDSFLFAKPTREQISKVRIRLKEIDEELINRLMEDNSQMFEDNNFELREIYTQK